MRHGQDNAHADEMAGPQFGPQGVDKAPGEEMPDNSIPVTQESQKGKTNDGDPNNPADQPESQRDL